MMVANIELPATADHVAIAEAAGNADMAARWRVNGRLYVQGVTQEALEAAVTPERLNPPVPAPNDVAAWAAKAVLENAGMLLSAEVAATAAGTEWKWRFLQANRWQRDKVQELRDSLNLTEAQVDSLLRQAAAIEVGG